MSQGLQTATETFFDRRRQGADVLPPVRERRQFTNSHEELSPDAAELARAVDAYKVRHRRRFITYEEILAVVQSLGYQRYSTNGTSSAGTG